jgi:hypothetical protein
MAKVSFKTTQAEVRLIRAIARRAFATIQALSTSGLTELDVQRILVACHANGAPLQLQALLTAAPIDFALDVEGIVRHINMATGTLSGGWRPRLLAHKQAA